VLHLDILLILLLLRPSRLPLFPVNRILLFHSQDSHFLSVQPLVLLIVDLLSNVWLLKLVPSFRLFFAQML
jgi:hypothetical protein